MNPVAIITSNQNIAQGVYSMTVSGAPLGRAGQFFMLRVPGALDPLLGRPISICEIDAQSGETTFVYQSVGRGTAQFAAILAGQAIEAQGPVRQRLSADGGPRGHPWRRYRLGAHAPARQKSSAQGDPARRIDVYLGFREEAYLMRANLKRYADSVTVNIGGFVTNDVDFTLDATFYACGPAPMLRAAAMAAGAANANLYISLEKHMACGVGACLGCTCQTTNGRKRVCKDGPVFDYREVRDEI